MDPSLAKGIKNQLFRELSHHVDVAIEKLGKYTESTRAGTSRGNWNRFASGVSGALSGMIIEEWLGGSKRHPFICLSTLDGQFDKKFNTWNERCINSILLYFNYSPWHFKSVAAGYSLGEHAIQRIYERSFKNSVLSATKEKLEVITAQIKYAPYWSAYWSSVAVSVFGGSDLPKIFCLLPAPNGVLLGEIRRESVHRLEIRTFVSDQLLRVDQAELKKKMIDLYERRVFKSLPFFAILDSVGIEASEAGFLELMDLVKPIQSNLLNLALGKAIALRVNEI